MKLMTKAIAKALHAADQIVINSDGMETPDTIVVKYFNPAGSGTWYITSGTPLDANGEMTTPDKAADWHLFGLCDLFADGGELGYVMLSELQSVELPFGLRIERDLSYTGKLSDHPAGAPLIAGGA